MNARHHAFWPRHLAKDVVIPSTSLYFNLEVSAARYPDKAAMIYYGRTLTYAELKQQVDALAGFLQTPLRRGAWRSGAARHAEQPAVRDRLLRDSARRCHGGAGEPDEPHRRIASLRRGQRCRHAFCAGRRCSRRLAPLMGAGLKHAIVAAYSDYIDPQSDLHAA